MVKDLLEGVSLDDIGSPVPLVLVTAVALYLSTIVLARVQGPRTLAAMSAFDVITNVAIGAVIGSTIVSPSIGLLNGLVAVGSLMALQFLVGLLRSRTRARSAIDDTPVVLMRDGQVVQEALVGTRLTEADLQGALRSANVHRYVDVDAVVLETSGSLSVLHHSSGLAEIDERLLDGLRHAGS